MWKKVGAVSTEGNPIPSKSQRHNPRFNDYNQPNQQQANINNHNTSRSIKQNPYRKYSKSKQNQLNKQFSQNNTLNNKQMTLNKKQNQSQKFNFCEKYLSKRKSSKDCSKQYTKSRVISKQSDLKSSRKMISFQSANDYGFQEGIATKQNKLMEIQFATQTSLNKDKLSFKLKHTMSSPLIEFQTMNNTENKRNKQSQIMNKLNELKNQHKVIKNEVEDQIKKFKTFIFDFSTQMQEKLNKKSETQRSSVQTSKFRSPQKVKYNEILDRAQDLKKKLNDLNEIKSTMLTKYIPLKKP